VLKILSNQFAVPAEDERNAFVFVTARGVGAAVDAGGRPVACTFSGFDGSTMIAHGVRIGQFNALGNGGRSACRPSVVFQGR